MEPPAHNVSTNSKGDLNEKSIKEESEGEKMTSKEKIAALEKKEWGKMKDIIFDSEESVLNYLSFHCKRYRDAKYGRFSPPKQRSLDEKRHKKREPHHDHHGTLNLPVHAKTFHVRVSPANSSQNVAASSGSSHRVDQPSEM